ncbi:enoyl-CoA hydratase/isomerase family protein [Streptomyces spinoverrucosus]|uniref:enoyl-CoA hydratase/isomerase family protein n=1 Tax=Streptomyces spinoverrucosus TaxID=284043 RepID=UPI0018C3AE04|nr:enoyl-CoA hydratase/isomerase family protein [Streptomyces spinoverrucosus]MBG0857152.1 enoyl-CoA hydratase/isomerase family protein [Streptomyces spinoverrucosus]
MSTVLRVELRDRLAVLTLDRPERLNAVGSETVRRLTEALEGIRDDDDVRALVVTGAGRAFSAGADLGEIESFTAPGQFRDFVGRLTEAYALLEDFPKPSVAAVHGFAFGGGLELVLACDLRVVERGARLGLPEMKLGVLPGAGGTQRLPRLLPPAIAKQMILSGEPIEAERAWQLGLVNELAEPGGALAAAEKLAGGLTAGAPLALAAGKRLIDYGVGMDLGSAIAYERETVTVLFSTEDRAEGLNAFRERRPGEFRGV